MFTVDPDPTFTRVVDVMVPTDGGHERQTVNATFRVVPTDEIAPLDLTGNADSTKFLCAAVAQLSDIVGADKQPLPWSDAVRDKLFQLPYLRIALTRSYFSSVNKAAEGN